MTAAASTSLVNRRAAARSSVTITSVCRELYARMCSSAASRSGTTRTLMSRRVLGPESSSVAAVRHPGRLGRGPGGVVGVQHDAGPGQLGQHLGQELGGDGLVDEERLGGVADAGALGLGVDHDGERLVEVGRRVDVDVAVADARLDDGHGGLGHDGLDEPGAAAGDHQVDEPAGGQQRPDGVAAALEQDHRVGGEALALQGLCAARRPARGWSTRPPTRRAGSRRCRT